jgi:hypothetical protein
MPTDSDILGSALPRDGMVFPLSVLGISLGALFCGYRHANERFEPDERDAIWNVAREFSIALFAQAQNGVSPR